MRHVCCCCCRINFRKKDRWVDRHWQRLQREYNVHTQTIVILNTNSAEFIILQMWIFGMGNFIFPMFSAYINQLINLLSAKRPEGCWHRRAHGSWHIATLLDHRFVIRPGNYMAPRNHFRYVMNILPKISKLVLGRLWFYKHRQVHVFLISTEVQVHIGRPTHRHNINRTGSIGLAVT